MMDSPLFKKPIYFGPYLLDLGSYDYPTAQPVSNGVSSQGSASTPLSSSTLIVIVIGVILVLIAIVSFYMFIKSLPKSRLALRSNVGVPYEKVYFAPDQVEPVENPVSQRSILIDYNSSLEEYMQHTRELEMLKYPSLVTDSDSVRDIRENPMLVTRESGRVNTQSPRDSARGNDGLLSMTNPMLASAQHFDDLSISEETLRTIKTVGFGSSAMNLNSSP